MKLESLKKLYVHELKDLYSAENQFHKALGKMAEKASNEDLAQAFRDHQKQTKTQIERLEKIFEGLEFSPSGEHCDGAEGLVKEAEGLMKQDIDPAVLDAGLIGAAQRVEHYEMAGYGTARAFAEKLGEREAADLLQLTLDEEAQTDEKLTRLAERSLNFQAMMA